MLISKLIIKLKYFLQRLPKPTEMYGLKIKKCFNTLQRTHFLSTVTPLMNTSYNNVQNSITEEQQTSSSFDLLTQQRCLKIKGKDRPSLIWGFAGGTSGEESVCQWRRCKRRGFNPWVGKIPWNKKGDSCLENSMDTGAWQATVYGAAKSRTQLNIH